MPGRWTVLLVALAAGFVLAGCVGGASLETRAFGSDSDEGPPAAPAEEARPEPPAPAPPPPPSRPEPPPYDPCRIAVPCDPPQPTCRPYAGVGAEVFPGLGATAFVGRVFSTSARRDYAWELAGSYQDQYIGFNDESQTGKLYAVRVGLRTRSNAGARGHWVGRAGAAWFYADGKPDEIKFDFVKIDDAGHYLGGYAGVGYEWCVGRGWTTGPEASVMAGWGVDGGGFAVAPTLRWVLTKDL